MGTKTYNALMRALLLAGVLIACDSQPIGVTVTASEPSSPTTTLESDTGSVDTGIKDIGSQSTSVEDAGTEPLDHGNAADAANDDTSSTDATTTPDSEDGAGLSDISEDSADAPDAGPEEVVGPLTGLSVSPEQPSTLEDLVASYVVPEGTPLDAVLTLQWTELTGQVVQGAVVPSSLTRKGQTWTATALLVDSEGVELDADTATLTIMNAAPMPFMPTLLPTNPNLLSTMSCATFMSMVDPDGEPISVTTNWYINDILVAYNTSSLVVPTALSAGVSGGSEVRCEVSASDGLATTIAEASAILAAVPVCGTEYNPCDPEQQTCIENGTTIPACDPEICEPEEHCPGAPAPEYLLPDLNPNSASFEQELGIQSYTDKAVLVALLSGW